MENVENVKNTKITDYLRKIPRIALFGITSNRVLVGIMLLLCVVVFPGFTIINSRGFYGGYGTSMCQAISLLLTYASSVIIPFVLYSYVQNRRECDFYNSMPVKRSQYFWGYFLSGLAIFLVPFTILHLIYGIMFGSDAFKYYLDMIVGFIVMYCTAIASILFSGSFLSSAVTFILRNAAPVALVLMPVVISGGDFYDYSDLLIEKICIFIPVTAVTGMWHYEPYQYIVILQLVIAFAELILAFFMHRHRRSESTMALAFPKTRYPYQYLVTLIAVMLTDAVLLYLSTNYEVFDKVIEALSSEEIALTVFFTVVVAFLVFVILNMILEKTGAAAFRKIGHFFAFLAGYAVLIVAIFLSPLGHLPRFVIPFTPDFVIINVAELREATEEEKEIVRKETEEYEAQYTAEYSSVAEENNSEDSDEKKRDFSYTYHTVEGYEEMYVYDKDEYYAVTDREKINELVHCAQYGDGKINLIPNSYKADGGRVNLKKGDKLYEAIVSFVEYPEELDINENEDDYSFIGEKATNARTRHLFLTDSDVLLDFADCHLKHFDRALMFMI